MEMYFVLFGCFAVPVLVCTMKKGRQCSPASSAMYPDIPVLAMIPDMRVSEKKNGYYSSYYGQTGKKGGQNHGGKQGA